MARKFLGGKPTVGSTDVPVVLESRTLTATAPVTIAGTTSADLSADRTIAVSAASTSAAGVVQLSDSTSTTSSTLAATATAVKSAADAAIPKSLIDAKGDLIVGSANDTAARLAVGATDGHVLTVDAAATNGIKWAAASSGAPTDAQYVTLTSNGTLSAERVLTAGSNVTITDGTTTVTVAATAKQEAFGSISSTSGTIDYDYTTATSFYHTSSPTADWTVNFTNVPTTNNFAYNFTIVVPQGATAKKVSAVSIAGSSATVKWAGSTAAPAGNNSKTDIWVFSLFRVSGAWTVLGVQSANFG